MRTCVLLWSYTAGVGCFSGPPPLCLRCKQVSIRKISDKITVTFSMDVRLGDLFEFLSAQNDGDELCGQLTH